MNVKGGAREKIAQAEDGSLESELRDEMDDRERERELERESEIEREREIVGCEC